LLHVAHCIISLLSFFIYWNALISFYQDYFNLSCHWHINIGYLIGLHIHIVDLVQKIINKGATQCKMWVWKNALAFIMWKNHNRMIIIPYYSWYSIPVFTVSTLFFPFIDHKFYKFVWFLKIILNKVCKLSGKYQLFWIDWNWFLHSTLKKKQLIFHNSQHKIINFHEVYK